jgi:hypothetical protein
MHPLRLISTLFLVGALVSSAGVATAHSFTLFVISGICWAGCVFTGLAAGFVRGRPGSWPATVAENPKTAEDAARPEGSTGWNAELPHTVVLYGAVVLFTMIVEVGINGLTQGMLLGGIVQVFATAFLVMGLRMAWLFLFVFSALDIIVALTADLGWWTLALYALMLALLLAPPTWRYAQRVSLDVPAR